MILNLYYTYVYTSPCVWPELSVDKVYMVTQSMHAYRIVLRKGFLDPTSLKRNFTKFYQIMPNFTKYHHTLPLSLRIPYKAEIIIPVICIENSCMSWYLAIVTYASPLQNSKASILVYNSTFYMWYWIFSIHTRQCVWPELSVDKVYLVTQSMHAYRIVSYSWRIS